MSFVCSNCRRIVELPEIVKSKGFCSCGKNIWLVDLAKILQEFSVYSDKNDVTVEVDGALDYKKVAQLHV